MQVNISDLRAISEKLFSHLEQSGHSSVEISTDYYWVISEKQRYNPNDDPMDFSLGQLSDDWSRLRAIAECDDPPIGYALVWLASVLQAIGEEIVA